MDTQYLTSAQSADESTTMKAAVLEEAGRFAVRDVVIPRPGPGEVRVRVKGCGVCASNVEPWSGPDWMEFPLAPGALGHEAWGVVDALGEGVDGLRRGQRVATLFQSSFAQYDCGPASEVMALPDDVPDPFPGEPLACAMNIFARSGIEAGQTVAIVGIGFLGAILTRLAVAEGARVIAISRRQSALDLARQNGAAHQIALDDHEAVVAAVGSLTSGHMCERVIEATGKQGPLDLAGELTAVRGRLIIAGYHQDGPRQVNMQMWNWRGLDVVNAHERDPSVYLSGMRKAIEAVRERRIELDGLLTHSFTLDRINEALAMTRDRPDGFLKAMVVMP